MSDEWTVVSKSKGRARKPRGSGDPPAQAVHSPAAGTRSARRGRQPSPERGGHGDGHKDDGEAEGAAGRLPGWGGGGRRSPAMNGRLGGRQKKKRQWVERTPEEKVEGLQRSVLDAKREVHASGFWASLRTALDTASHSGNDDRDLGAESIDGSSASNTGLQNGRSTARDCLARRDSAVADDCSREQRQHNGGRLRSDSADGCGGASLDRRASSMSLDRPAGSSAVAMATSPQASDAAAAAEETDTAASPEAPPAARAIGAEHAAEADGVRRGVHRWRWDAVTQLVVYGLGSFESGPVPRHQLALVLLLAEALGERLQAPPQLFDPAFTKVDKALIQRLGCELISQNEHGRRIFGGGDGSGGDCALVYLAHCKPELANNLLDANWAAERLASFAIIGNSMGKCVETWGLPSMRRTFKERPSRVLSAVAAAAVAETAIPEGGYSAVGAFNDVCLHVFTDPQVAGRPDAAPPDSD